MFAAEFPCEVLIPAVGESNGGVATCVEASGRGALDPQERRRGDFHGWCALPGLVIPVIEALA